MMAASFASYHIREWPASYYQNESRTWYYGILHINVGGVIFTENQSKSPRPMLLHLLFSDIAEVKKTTTGLIFGALVIVTNTGLKHWISSLPDRSGVFNAICYFKRCVVLPRSEIEKRSKLDGGGTEMGRKLLGVAYDSQSTLKNSAEVLKYQGDQLDAAAMNMYDIHNDLDVADNLISGLENWFGRWTIPEEYKYIEPMVVKDSDLSQDLEFEVLYTKLEMNKLNSQNLGLVRICHEGLYILTDKQRLVHHFKWTDISVVKVISLWEILVSRFRIGQPDLKYSVVFSTLFSVLRVLDKRLRSKMEYSQDAFQQMAEPHAPKLSQLHPAEEKRQLSSYKSKFEPDSGGETISSDIITDSSSSNQATLEVTKSKEVVTDEEVRELSGVLSDLKSLALEVQKETDVQNEKIDKLNDTVQEANERLKHTEKRVNKLL